MTHRRRSACLALLLVSALPAAAQPRFVDITEAAGITFRHVFGGPEKLHILEAHGSGAALFDADGDGDLDAYLVNGATFDSWRDRSGPGNALYRNLDGDRFEDISAASGTDHAGWGAGVAAGDVDNDGRRDLYVTNYGPNVLYANTGGARFVDVTDSAGVGGDDFSAGAAFADIDNDGDLDLYVTSYVVFDTEAALRDGPRLCSFYGGLQVYCGPKGYVGAPDRLYRNDGDGTGAWRFTDITEAAGIAAANRYYGLGVVPSDLDNDGDIDLAVANDETPNVLWRNDGDGTFTDVALIAGLAYNGEGDEEAGMGIDAGDIDADGDEDLHLTHFFSETNTLYRNDSTPGEWGLRFSDITALSGIGAPSVSLLAWGTRFLDVDHDGRLDVFVANGHVYPQVDHGVTGSSYRQPDQLFLQNADGTFRDASRDAGLADLPPRVSRGTAAGDIDDDGDVDLLVSNLDDRPSLLRNDQGAGGGGWLQVEVRGTSVNGDGIGTRIAVVVGTHTQWRTVTGSGSYLSAHDLRAHVGLGSAATVDRVDIFWPDGSTQSVAGVPANHRLVIEQGGNPTMRSLPPPGKN